MANNPFLFDGGDIPTGKTVNSSNPFMFDEPTQTTTTTVADDGELPTEKWYPGKEFVKSMEGWGEQALTPFVNDLKETGHQMTKPGPTDVNQDDLTLLKGVNALIQFPFAAMGGIINEIPLVGPLVSKGMFEYPANVLASTLNNAAKSYIAGKKDPLALQQNPIASLVENLKGKPTSPGEVIQSYTGKTEEEQMKDPGLYSSNKLLELGLSIPGMALFHGAAKGTGKAVDFAGRVKDRFTLERDAKAKAQMEQVEREKMIQQAKISSQIPSTPDMLVDNPQASRLSMPPEVPQVEGYQEKIMSPEEQALAQERGIDLMNERMMAEESRRAQEEQAMTDAILQEELNRTFQDKPEALMPVNSELMAMEDMARKLQEEYQASKEAELLKNFPNESITPSPEMMSLVDEYPVRPGSTSPEPYPALERGASLPGLNELKAYNENKRVKKLMEMPPEVPEPEFVENKMPGADENVKGDVSLKNNELESMAKEMGIKIDPLSEKHEGVYANISDYYKSEGGRFSFPKDRNTIVFDYPEAIPHEAGHIFSSNIYDSIKNGKELFNEEPNHNFKGLEDLVESHNPIMEDWNRGPNGAFSKRIYDMARRGWSRSVLFREAIAEGFERINDGFESSLPSTTSYLKEKIKEYREKNPSPKEQVSTPVESKPVTETISPQEVKGKKLVVSKNTAKEIYGKAGGKDATTLQAAIDKGSIPKKLIKYAKELIRRFNEPGAPTSGPATSGMFGSDIGQKLWEDTAKNVSKLTGKAVGELMKLPDKVKKTIVNLTRFAELEENNVSGTSRPQVPAMVNDKRFLAELEPGDTVYDIGGGKYNFATEILDKVKQVKNIIIDFQSRPWDFNVKSALELSEKPPKVTMVNNVLNTIEKPELRKAVIQEAFDYTPEGGKSFFLIYEGTTNPATGAKGGDGIGRPLKSEGGKTQWQNYKWGEEYIPEIEAVFGKGNVTSWGGHGNRIMATKPKATPPPSGKKVGKVVQGSVYVHKSAVDRAGIPMDRYNEAKSKLPDGFEYDIVRYDKNGDMAFVRSKDFDTNPEPVMGEQYTVKADGTLKYRREMTDNPQIYHKKYTMVGEDYTGFDIAEAKRRTAEWEALKPDKNKMGYKKFWDENVVPQLGGGGVMMIDPLKSAKYLAEEAGRGVEWLKSKGKETWNTTKDVVKDMGAAAVAEWKASKSMPIGTTPANKAEWARDTVTRIWNDVTEAAYKTIKESKMDPEVAKESVNSLKLLKAELAENIGKFDFSFNQGIGSLTSFMKISPFSPRMAFDIVKRFVDEKKMSPEHKAAYNAIDDAIKTVETFEKLSSQWIQRDYGMVQKVFKDKQGNFKYDEKTENNVWDVMKDADRGNWTWEQLHNDPRITKDYASAKLAKELETLQGIFDKKIARMSKLTGMKIEKKPGVYVHRVIESGKNVYTVNPAGKQRIISVIKTGREGEISNRFRQAATNLLYEELFGISENRIFDDSWAGNKDILSKIKSKLGDVGDKTMIEYYSERQPIMRALKRLLSKNKEWKNYEKLNNTDMTRFIEGKFGKGTVARFERAMKLRDVWSKHITDLDKKIKTTSDKTQSNALKAQKVKSINSMRSSYDPVKITAEINKFDPTFDPKSVDVKHIWESVFKEKLKVEPSGNPVLNKFDIPNQWKTYSGKFLNFEHAKTLRDAMAQYIVDINQGMGNTEMLTKLSKLKTEHSRFNEVSDFINKLGRYVSGQERFMDTKIEKTMKFINSWQANSKMLFRPSFHIMQLTQPIENIKYFGTSEIAGLNIPGLSDAVRLATGTYRTGKALTQAARQAGAKSKINAISKLLSNPKMEDYYKIAEATGQFSSQTLTTYDAGFGGKAEAHTRSISEKRSKGAGDYAKDALDVPQKVAMANDNMARLATNNTYFEMFPKEFENMKKAMKETNDFTEMEKLDNMPELKESFDRYMQIIDKVNVNYGRSGHAMVLYEPIRNMVLGAFKKYDYHKFGEGVEMVSDVMSRLMGKRMPGFNDNMIVRGNMMGAGLLAQMALGGWRSTRIRQLMAGYALYKGIQALWNAYGEKDAEKKKELEAEANRMFQNEIFEDDSWAKLIEEQPDATRKAFFDVFWNGIPNWASSGNVDISTRVTPNATVSSPQFEGAYNVIGGFGYVKGNSAPSDEKKIQKFINGFLTPLYGTDIYGGFTMLKFDALSRNPNNMTEKEKAELKVLDDALVAMGNTHESSLKEFGPFDYKEKAPSRELTKGEIFSKFLGFNSQKARDEFASMYVEMQRTKFNKKEGDDLKKKFARALIGKDIKEQKAEFKTNKEEIQSFRERTGKGVGFEGARNLAMSGSDPVEAYVRDMDRLKFESDTGKEMLANSMQSGKYRRLMEILEKRIEEHDNIQNRRLRRKMLNLKKEYDNLTQ